MNQRGTRATVDLRQIEHGWDVYAADGEKVGDVSEVHTNYLVVSKGFLFTTERYVPASAIRGIEHDRVYLRVNKDAIDAQGWDRVPQDTERVGMTGSARVAEDQDTLRLREEELRARKETVETGEVAVRKEVVAEQQTIEVPVTREEVVIEHRAVDRAEAERTSAGEIREGETIRVPVREEQVTIEKRPVVTEEIEIGKRAVQETEHVTETVRREEAVVDHDEDVAVRHRESGIPHEER